MSKTNICYEVIGNRQNQFRTRSGTNSVLPKFLLQQNLNLCSSNQECIEIRFKENSLTKPN